MWQSDPPPRHQRRLLVTAERLLAATGGGLAGACRRWQEAHLGGLFVAVTGDGVPGQVGRLVRLGLAPQLVVFFEPRAVPGLSALARLLRDRSPRPRLPEQAATLAAVGATHVAGLDPEAVAICRDLADQVNARLRAAELVRPRPLGEPPQAPPAGEPAPIRAGAVPGQAAAAALLAEGARRVARECEQRLDLLEEAGLLGAADRGVPVP